MSQRVDDLHAFAMEPIGGIPTIAYAKLCSVARDDHTIVLLDGQGMDEAWAGYDYYHRPRPAETFVVQGSTQSPLRPGCVVADWRVPQTPATEYSSDPIVNQQLRDIFGAKLTRALRFNDRASMMSGVELREPFLDHRLVRLGIGAPASLKFNHGVTKYLPRSVVTDILNANIVEAPKRPVQTPQREWLAGPLRPWVIDMVDLALEAFGGVLLEPTRVRHELDQFFQGRFDNSFFVWQWVGLGVTAAHRRGYR